MVKQSNELFLSEGNAVCTPERPLQAPWVLLSPALSSDGRLPLGRAHRAAAHRASQAPVVQTSVTPEGFRGLHQGRQ